MEDIRQIPLGCIIDIDIEENVEIGAGYYYFANMTKTDIMEMYMSFIEEDWEENVQISQGYEYMGLQTEDWWYGMPRKQILNEIANKYVVGIIANIPFYNS